MYEVKRCGFCLKPVECRKNLVDEGDQNAS